jgi:aryl-alcohol dehydrogenase-like predicted oxidoreductase
MNYKHIGGMEVSQFALGTWHLPPSNKKDTDGILYVDIEKSRKIFKKAMDLGINFFDTANTYHGTISETHLHPEKSGNAERILGDFLKDYERESVVVATKVRAEVAKFHNGGGLSRKHISWQIRESLSRLQTPYIDLYQIHWEDPYTPPAETMDILNDLVHRGLVHYIGTSNHPPARTNEMMKIAADRGWENFVTMQEAYNLINRNFELDKYTIARKNSMALLAYTPLAEGILSGKYSKSIVEGTRGSYTEGFGENIEKSRETVEKFLLLAKELDVKPTQLALAWMLKMQEKLGITIIPILGATNVSQLEDNVMSLEVKIPDDVFKDLNALVKVQ